MSATNGAGWAPAFPTELGPGDGGFQSGNERWHAPGMTLRDYFAAKAIVGVMTMAAAGRHDLNKFDGSMPEEAIAFDAYRVADAMLKARGA